MVSQATSGCAHSLPCAIPQAIKAAWVGKSCSTPAYVQLPLQKCADVPIVCGWPGLDGTQAGEPSNGVGDAEDGGMGNSRRAAPKTSGAVGPPSAAGSRLAQEGVHYEDGEADEEADSGFSEDDDDELDFSKMGMHAEL